MTLFILNPTNFDGHDSLNVKSPTRLLNEVIGPMFIGFNISVALFGVTCIQACVYFKRNSQDTTQLKSIVVTLVLLESLHIAFLTHGIYVCGITNHGGFHCFQNAVWSLIVQAIPSTVAAAIVQYVWIIRIRTLSQSKRKAQIAVGMQFMVVTQMVMSIALTAKASRSPRWDVIRSEQWPVVACFVLRAFNDVSLTGALCYHLQRSKNGLRDTDGMIQKMMGYGLRTGVFNCMGSVASMVLLVVVPTKLVYVGVYLVFSSLYTNSLLAVLNWRRSLQVSELSVSEAPETEGVELSTVWGLAKPGTAYITTRAFCIVVGLVLEVLEHQ